MLEQQNEIYTVSTATKDKPPELKHVSPQDLEQWELYHTELGCYYAQFISKNLQRFRKETAELDLEKVEASRTT